MDKPALEIPGKQSRGSRFKRLALLLTVMGLVAGALIWFFLRQSQTPEALVEKEVQRIFTKIRRTEGVAGQVRSIIEAMREWPTPFSQLANLTLGNEAEDSYGSFELAELGPLAIPALTNALVRDPVPRVRSEAASALGIMGGAHLAETLIVAFGNEPEAYVKESIVRALGNIQEERVESWLIKVLNDETQAVVRESAARALADFTSPAVLSVLTNLLATELDTMTASGLLMDHQTWLQRPEAKPALLAELRTDRNASVRRSVASALRYHPDDETVAALITALREDADWRLVRAAAAGALGQITNSMVKPALLEGMAQDHAEVRAASASALAGVPGDEVEAALVNALASDPTATVRAAAAHALGRKVVNRERRGFLAALVKSLRHDADEQVRAAAAEVLSRIGDREVVTVLRDVLTTERKGQVQVEAIGGIFRHSSQETGEFLLKLLNDGNLEADAEVEAVRGLGYLRAAAAIPKLSSILTSASDAHLRQTAAEALGSIGGTNVVTPLITALTKDDAPYVRAGAAAALGELTFASTPVISALSSALARGPDGYVRAAAATALGELKDSSAQTPLVTALRRDRDRKTRAAAAAALGKLGRQEAVAYLEKAFQHDRDKSVRVNAIRSLAQIADHERGPFFIKVFETEWRMRSELASVLGWLGSPEATAVLRKSFTNEAGSERAAVITALGDAGDTNVLPQLTAILQRDHSATIRAAAATSLGRLCRAEAVPALTKALEDRSPSVRQEAAWAMGHIGASSGVPALVDALKRGNDDVRFAAAFALAEVGDRSAAPELLLLLNHANDRTRLAAASALAFLDDASGVLELEKNLRKEDAWRRFTALISLLRLNTAATQRLLTERHEADSTLRAVIEAGLRLGGVGAATNMLAAAPDNGDMLNDFRHFGARALILFNDPAALAALRQFENEPREDVRATVRIAIRRLEQRAGIHQVP